MGIAWVNEEFGSIRAPQVQYPSCSGRTFLNLILHSVLSLPKAGNDFTSRFQGCDWFSCRQDHWHSRTGNFVLHIICAEDPAGTSTTFSCFANVMRISETCECINPSQNLLRNAPFLKTMNSKVD